MPQVMKISRIIREGLGLTKYAMAKKLGVSHQTYAAIERKSTNVHLKHLISLWHIAYDELGWTHRDFLGALEMEVREKEEKQKGK